MPAAARDRRRCYKAQNAGPGDSPASGPGCEAGSRTATVTPQGNPPQWPDSASRAICHWEFSPGASGLLKHGRRPAWSAMAIVSTLCAKGWCLSLVGCPTLRDARRFQYPRRAKKTPQGGTGCQPNLFLKIRTLLAKGRRVASGERRLRPDLQEGQDSRKTILQILSFCRKFISENPF